MSAPASQPDKMAAVPVLERMFRFQWEEAQQCYVLLYPEGMVRLNDSAGEILALVDGARSVARICSQLEQKFPAAGDLSGDILEFMEVALEQRWIHYRR
jgi:pyrroloquinoline quinone biosynthesis protein D